MENKIVDWFKIESIYLVKKDTVPRAIALFVFMNRISVKFSCCNKASDQDKRPPTNPFVIDNIRIFKINLSLVDRFLPLLDELIDAFEGSGEKILAGKRGEES